MNDYRFLKGGVATIILSLIILRTIIIFQTRMETLDDWYYVGRQTLYTITWATMAYFLFREFLIAYTFNKTHREKRNQNMERLSLIVAIGCVLNVLTMIYYHTTEIVVSENEVISVHNFIEVGAWVLLAVYFFFYYFFHRGMRIKMNRQRHNMLLENMRSAEKKSHVAQRMATELAMQRQMGAQSEKAKAADQVANAEAETASDQKDNQ